jgi:hypothetical protein
MKQTPKEYFPVVDPVFTQDSDVQQGTKQCEDPASIDSSPVFYTRPEIAEKMDKSIAVQLA